jgi:GTP cyclohydrolase IA
MRWVDSEPRSRPEDTVLLEVQDETIAPGAQAVPVGSDPVVADVRRLLTSLGQDVERPGLVRTPERVARMYHELLSGYDMDPGLLINGALFPSDYNGIVLVRDIEFHSLCEHHLLPFFGRVHVAYVPDGQVVGLSKIPRIVDMFARRLQLQEQMTQQIAECIDDLVKPKGVAVAVEGVHQCMMIRGVQKTGARMVTRTLLGAFEHDAELKRDLETQMGPLGSASLL